MQGGDYPDVIHLATGREAGLTEQFINDKLIADITDVLDMTIPGEDVTVGDKIIEGFTDTSATNPYNDGKTYLAPMFYSTLRPVLQRRPLRGEGLDRSHHLGRDVGARRQGP